MLAGCRNSMTNNSLNEVKAIASGKSLPSPLHEATEVYAIARYIEFELLAQNCEDVIVRNINSDTFLSIYSWATESFGSAFVQRQCER